MMRKILIACFTLFLSVSAHAASTSYQATLGSGAAFATWCIGGSGPACTGGVFWPSTVIANSSGTELFTSGNPGFVSVASLPLPSGAATSANQSTEITALNTLNTTAGNPINLEASSSEPSKATTGNPIQSFSDLVGKQVTSPYANRENQVRGTATGTTTSAVTLLAASGSASLKTYAWASCGRTDAGTSAITVTFNDVEGTGSGTIMVLPNNGGGGGNNQTDPIPMVTAANTALTFAMSTNTTSVICNARGFTGY